MHDDDHLLRAMVRRDPTAWDAMYRRHVGDVFGVVYHLVGGDRHVAEDVNQEVWMLAIDRFGQFNRAALRVQPGWETADPHRRPAREMTASILEQ